MKVISLFAGAGGMDIGFEQAGFDIVVAVETDPSCCNTLRRNRPNLTVIEGDISKISGGAIMKAAGIKRSEAALIIGGPPCQSFSLAGKRMGLEDQRGSMILEYARLVHEILPRAFVMENVKGMLNWEKGKAIDAVINEFKEARLFRGQKYNYNVSYEVLNAANFGVAQNRERLFMVGNRSGKVFKFPTPKYGNISADDFCGDVKPSKTVWDAIGHLPKADKPSATAMRVSQTIKGRIAKHGY